MGEALQGFTAGDDNLPNSVSLDAASPSLPGFGQGISGINDKPQFPQVKEVEEKVHVGAVGNVHEGEILLLR